ncbi:glycosyltransferase involved in cell wall biosynthesis [Rhizobium mesoamericanum]|uniref:glycosyltransferase n=1 Tax=Rhizobium mesoamericanum TaxID=1079800 RepID=UPI0027878FA3|nr:glycosyltransferase [Rhizobium mesoamericanum]MDQ0562529.1 glycosyltransferase involved in cell wall biosynthesis [Rhizobium mesoamericanum]
MWNDKWGRAASQPQTEPDRRQKILYIQVHTSTFAGIERVIDTICTFLTDRHPEEFDIDVLYTSHQEARPKEPRNFNTIDRLARGRIDVMRTYRDVIASKNYDLVVVPQIEPTVICMVSCLGLSRKFAIYLHGNPRVECTHPKARILFFLMRWFFLARVASVFGTSARQLECFRTMFNSKRPQYQLPNPVRRFEFADAETVGEPGYVTFVNVGRFDPQKGQDILVRAFSELLKVRENVRLKLVGQGNTEVGLRDLMTQLGIDASVSIERHPVDPQPALATSDVYVSTSRWEGWSLAICEALRFGLPVISTECDFGPDEILIDPRLGRLVPVGAHDELVQAMVYYCDNLQEEHRHAAFRRLFIDRYSPEHVVDIHAHALHLAIRQPTD